MGHVLAVVWADQAVLADSTKALPVALPAPGAGSHAVGQTANPIARAGRAGALRSCQAEATDPPYLGTDTSKGSQSATRAMRSRKAYTRCERISTTQICTRISSCLLLHHCDIRRLLFEQTKSHFTIEASRIQLGHLPPSESTCGSHTLVRYMRTPIPSPKRTSRTRWRACRLSGP